MYKFKHSAVIDRILLDGDSWFSQLSVGYLCLTMRDTVVWQIPVWCIWAGDRRPCHARLRILSKHFFRDAVSQEESDLQSPLRVASKFLLRSQDRGVQDRRNENPIIDPRHEWSLSVWNLFGSTRTSVGSLRRWGREREAVLGLSLF